MIQCSSELLLQSSNLLLLAIRHNRIMTPKIESPSILAIIASIHHA